MRLSLDRTREAAETIATRVLQLLQRRRRQAYRDTMYGDNGELRRPAKIMLADLARFCRAADTTFDPDPRVHALLEGRREVWLRIQAFLHLEEREVVTLDPEERAIMEEANG